MTKVNKGELLERMQDEYGEILQGQKDKLAELQLEYNELLVKLEIFSPKVGVVEKRLKERANFDIEEEKQVFSGFKERYFNPIEERIKALKDEIECLEIDIKITEMAKTFSLGG